MNKIKFKQIDPEVKPWVNGAFPSVVIKSGDVLMTYLAENNRIPGGIDGKHTVKFNNCLMYRIGDPNDHGFYQSGLPGINNNSIYSVINFPDLEFFTFNKVIGVDWKNELLGEGTEVLDDKYEDANLKDYNHYLWFMKDGTFECVSKNYKAIKKNDIVHL